MSLKALIYAYVLGGVTFLPLLICAAIAWTIYTSVPVGDPDPAKLERKKLSDEDAEHKEAEDPPASFATNDQVRPRKAWLTVRRTFEERETDVSYVNMMRTFLDSRSKDPKRSRPKDMWYVVLKGSVLYLYEDEAMTECEAAIQVASHEVVVYPEGLMDGELFTRRNAICLKPLAVSPKKGMSSITNEMKLEAADIDEEVDNMDISENKKRKEKEKLAEVEKLKSEASAEAFDSSTPWFIFVRSCVEMEDWYMALVHAANYSTSSSSLEPVRPVFLPSDMHHLVSTLDDQPDVIPMRWLNALIGRIFFSFYKTQTFEDFIIGRIMKKISKVKTPSFLQNIAVTEVSVGNTPPSFSKPMLKELTQEGDAALEIRLMYKGEVRLTVEATAIINLGQRFKTYSVKLVLAVVLRKIDGNLLVKVKRPPTNRIWYAFTQPPEMVLDVEPVVSDRQIKWGMILSTIESRIKEVINESVVLPNMDDIAFFESAQYQHRGGIWADARRKEHVVSDILSDASAAPSASVDKSGIQKSQSADEIPAVPNDLPEPEIVTRAATVGTSEPAESPKRSTWFSTVRSAGAVSLHDEGAESTPDIRTERPTAVDIERGRSTESSTSENGGRRAASVPAASISPTSTSTAEGSGVDGDLHAEGDASAASDTIGSESSLQPPTPRIRSLSSGANMVSDGSSLSSDRASLSRDALANNTRQNAGTTNTSSFLSVLKAKTDKQALSNTAKEAKEAMRKWSANWNFKREQQGSGSGSSVDDTADTGGVQPEANSTSSLFSFPSRRGNYADIRAAVSGRKEKGRNASSSSERAPIGSGSSIPIDIPSRGTSDYQSDSAPHSASHSASSSLSVNDNADPVGMPSTQTHSHSPRGPSLLRQESARASPTPPKLTTQISSTDSTNNSSVGPTPSIDVSPSSPIQPAPPIKTQPSQGAIMTVPGIHASHRGEVMSLGYAPPAPAPQSPSTPESKIRAPAMQSMYRLFKSPTSGGSTLQSQQQQQSSSQSVTSPSTNPDDTSSATDENDDTPTPSMPTSPAFSSQQNEPASSPAIMFKAPPPLPPRRASVSASPSPSRTVSPTPGSPNSSSSTPSASDALKLIAEQDSSRRSLEEATRPPQHGTNKSKKRTSLGAKRIASPRLLDELFNNEGGAANGAAVTGAGARPSEGTPLGREQQANDVFSGSSSAGSAQSDASTRRLQDSSTHKDLLQNGAVDKPNPPPLPPRRFSTSVTPS